MPVGIVGLQSFFPRLKIGELMPVHRNRDGHIRGADLRRRVNSRILDLTFSTIFATILWSMRRCDRHNKKSLDLKKHYSVIKHYLQLQ
jgi:hypothetical protein